MGRERDRAEREVRRRRRIGIGRAGASWPLLALVLALCGAPPVAAQEVTGAAAIGVMGIDGDDDVTFLFDLEYRLKPGRHRIAPVLGGAATSDGTTYLRAGLGRDFQLAPRWTSHMNVAAGLYFEGESGKRLGGALEFRSAIDLSYQVAPDLRVGLALAHLSNAGLGSFNPGVETFSLVLSWRQPPRARRGPR